MTPQTVKMQLALMSTVVVASSFVGSAATTVWERPTQSPNVDASKISIPSSSMKPGVSPTRVTLTPEAAGGSKEVVMAKLVTIERLQDGWDGPGSLAVKPIAFQGYRDLVDRFLQVPVELEPMPTPRGGLRMEWDRGEYSYVAEIEGDGGMFLCAIGPTESDDYELELEKFDVQKLLDLYRGLTIA